MPGADKPLFTDEEKLKLRPNGEQLGNDIHSNTTTVGGTSPTASGMTANPNTFPGARRGVDYTNKSTSSRTNYIQGMYWQTGDMQVLVGGTHEYRIHQEIMARHSTFFAEQLRASTDSDGIIATRSEDIPVVVLREITGEAFEDVIRLLYPSPTALKQPLYTTCQAERLLSTASSLGMPGVMDFAMELLSISPSYSILQFLRLAEQFSLVHWKVHAIQTLVYRTRPVSNAEAEVLGAVLTAQVARLREFFRARIFARFEPVVPARDGDIVHRSGAESEAIQALDETVSTGGLNLGPCQQAIYEALKIVFDVDGRRPHFVQYTFNDMVSVMGNLEMCLRPGLIGGGARLCKGCLESVGRLVQVYCRVEEMDSRIASEIGGWDVGQNVEYHV